MGISGVIARAGRRSRRQLCLAAVGAVSSLLALGLASSASAGQNLAFGVDVPTGFYAIGPIDSFQRLVHNPVNLVQNFVSWEYTATPAANRFPSGYVKRVISSGRTPEITWDPTITGDPLVDQPAMNLASIAAGAYDRYIRQFARAAAAVHSTILLRFAHEMNGDWQDFYVGNSGNAPGDFVRAWRHVHAIFEEVGATNVSWVWSPNIVAPGDHSLAALYPGNAYVNWVGLDGYSYPVEGCEAAQTEFTPALNEIRRFASKPVMLAEVGIDSDCQDKPQLIARLFSWLESQPEIRSIVYWERKQDGADWLIQSSAASESAFRTGLSVWRQWLETHPAPAERSRLRSR